MNSLRSTFLPFYLIVLSFFLIRVSPDLLAEGMFMDGIFYAAISKNLAESIGTFWDLRFSKSLFLQFNGHPPLAFGIQSIFFRTFGDSLWIEKLYSLATYFITAGIIILIWRKTVDKKFYAFAWLPLLLWVVIPLTVWGATANVLENTMMIFVTLSVFFIINSLNTRRFFHLFLAGIILFFGFLTKGFTALFPWSMLLWIWLFTRRIQFKRLLIDTSFLILATLFPLLIIYIFNYEGIKSLAAYLDRQVIYSVNHIKTVNSRFHILWRLFTELIPLLIILLLSLLFIKESSENPRRSKERSGWLLIFAAVGLSGVLPIMVSMKQSGFYILAALPFFGIAAALIIVPRIAYWTNTISNRGWFRFFRLGSFLLLLTSVIIVFMQIGRVRRDKELIGDTHLITATVPYGTVVGIQPDLTNEWGLHGYLYRYGGISLDSDTSRMHTYLIKRKIGTQPEHISGYKRVALKSEAFDLYKKAP